MNFVQYGWWRDLQHMVGCFYASQVRPLTSPEWEIDFRKFLGLMEERKATEWLDLKELTPLRFMPYVAKCFEEATGHHLSGLSEHTRWIRAKGYYDWKVVELKQLTKFPHLRGLSIPKEPMLRPSVSEWQQGAGPKPPKAKTTMVRAAGQPTSHREVGGAGDSRSWYDQVVATEKARQKRRRTDSDQPM